MEKGIDTQVPVIEIIDILNKHEIPIALIPDVFSRVIDAINQNTVPYNPNLLNIRDFATSEITDKVTDPTG